MATLHAIHLRPAARSPVRTVPAAEAVAGVGLAGDHAHGGRRQVTLLDLAAWHTACRELGRDLESGVRRANLVVDGLDLAAAVGTTVCVGDVRIEVLGETRPCELMDDDGRTGLQAALRKERRAGVFGRIARGGTVRVGMACAIDPAPAPAGSDHE